MTKKERMLKLLDDTVAHFNSGNRCFSKDRGKCLYVPVNDSSQGCAIGRLLPAKHKKFITDNDAEDVGVAGLFCSFDTAGLNIPKVFAGLSVGMGLRFLASLQDLHDSGEYWCSTGLTESGRQTYKEIKEYFEL